VLVADVLSHAPLNIRFNRITSREKAILGAPKLPIPGHFGLSATYMPAVMLTAGEFCGAPGIKKLPLAHLVCAPWITFYLWRTSDRCAGDKISENSKIQKISKIF
jgi:hypothetical protein